MNISPEEIDRLASKLEAWPANGKPAFDDDVVTLKAYGLIEEIEQKAPCRTCGTPRVDYTYMKITPAGRLFLLAARPPKPKLSEAEIAEQLERERSVAIGQMQRLGAPAKDWLNRQGFENLKGFCDRSGIDDLTAWQRYYEEKHA